VSCGGDCVAESAKTQIEYLEKELRVFQVNYPEIGEICEEMLLLVKNDSLRINFFADHIATLTALKRLLPQRFVKSNDVNKIQIEFFTLPTPTLTLQDKSISFNLNAYQDNVIGRTGKNLDFALPNYINVSAKHATIRLRSDIWQIQDCHSKNGTYVNGNSVSNDDWHDLKSGDEIILGSPVPNLTSAILRFEDQNSLQKLEKILKPCHVSCLITPQLLIPAEIDRLFLTASKFGIQSHCVLFETSNNSLEAKEIVIFEQGIKSKFDLIELYCGSIKVFESSYNDDETVLQLEAQPSLGDFVAHLDRLVSQKSGIIDRWLNAMKYKYKLKACKIIENSIDTQNLIQSEIQRRTTLIDSRIEDFKKSFNTACDEIDYFLNDDLNGLIVTSKINNLRDVLEKFLIENTYFTPRILENITKENKTVLIDLELHNKVVIFIVDQVSKWEENSMKVCEEKLFNSNVKEILVECSIDLNKSYHEIMQDSRSKILSNFQTNYLPFKLDINELNFKDVSFFQYLLAISRSMQGFLTMFLVIVTGSLGVINSPDLQLFSKSFNTISKSLLLLFVLLFAALFGYRNHKKHYVEDLSKKIHLKQLDYYFAIGSTIFKKTKETMGRSFKLLRNKTETDRSTLASKSTSLNSDPKILLNQLQQVLLKINKLF
jgi:pSer/pThr/pTyr-binding forkhead associated (FHA) protein